ncbi:hypothetical protein ACFTXJ_14690 [Streptomyces zhihengii]|uniref:hypothetical protein n=1 Tax=Streptomyces zhihengii TaxID=1818004 RepID=UPI00362A5757
MTQISFPLDKAHEALDQFLNDGDREHDGRRMARNVLDAKGNECLAVILDPAHHRELLDTYHAFNDSQEPNEDPDLPPGYRPYIHSPNATTDRLLPHEPLHKPLAHAMYRKPFNELPRNEQDRVIGVAITCLLRATFDADSQGAVPILMLSHAGDDPEPRQFWQLAYKTDVDGLFLRANGNGFFGEEWQIVTGAGWRLFSGWWSREDAARAAAAVARALPFIDWMSATPDAFTDKSKTALGKVLRRYHVTGLREDQPEPEPLTEEPATT